MALNFARKINCAILQNLENSIRGRTTLATLSNLPKDTERLDKNAPSNTTILNKTLQSSAYFKAPTNYSNSQLPLEPYHDKSYKLFENSNTYKNFMRPLKKPKLASPFPDPVKEMPSDTVSDEEKAAQMQADVKKASFAGINMRQTRCFSTSGPDSEKCKKMKPKKKKDCPKKVLPGCKPPKTVECNRYAFKDCKKKKAPYPSYSEACHTIPEEKPSECKLCPWKKAEHPHFQLKKKKYHTSAATFCPRIAVGDMKRIKVDAQDGWIATEKWHKTKDLLDDTNNSMQLMKKKPCKRPKTNLCKTDKKKSKRKSKSRKKSSKKRRKSKSKKKSSKKRRKGKSKKKKQKSKSKKRKSKSKKKKPKSKKRKRPSKPKKKAAPAQSQLDSTKSWVTIADSELVAPSIFAPAMLEPTLTARIEAQPKKKGKKKRRKSSKKGKRKKKSKRKGKKKKGKSKKKKGKSKKKSKKKGKKSRKKKCKKMPFDGCKKKPSKKKKGGKEKCQKPKRRKNIRDCPGEKKCKASTPLHTRLVQFTQPKPPRIAFLCKKKKGKCPDAKQNKCDKELEEDPCGLRRKGKTKKCPTDLLKKKRRRAKKPFKMPRRKDSRPRIEPT